ncbi:MAG: hypothetical protein KF688_04980 [Pirellulales bacterium]|nr:hypothetical protein [Pirellulales bacterium]
MPFDLEVPVAARICHATGRPIDAGAAFYSEATLEAGILVRRDVAAEAWTGPGPHVLAWWKCQALEAAAKPKLAPHEVLLNLFAELADQPAETEFRYVLGLLLIRRRLLRLEETRRDGAGVAWMRLDCPSRKEQFELAVVEPSPERMAEVEARLVETLYAEA